MRRLFVGIPASGDLQREVIQWQGEFYFLPVWKTPKKNLHITLVPPFYEDNYKRVADKLRGAAGAIKNFSLRFDRVIYGPNLKTPRLVWAEGETTPELLGLRNETFRALGLRPDKRPFLLHLTLARFPPENFSMFPVQKLLDKISWSESVVCFALFESVLAPDGAHYKILEKFLL